jgi:catechol 2,3-dioxygenase-like lactoylglutathione lyase family enzyme
MASGRVTGVFHAGITVSDLDAALAFYHEALGLELLSLTDVADDDAWRIWNLRGERARLAFLRVPGSDTLLELIAFEGLERHAASARPCDHGAGHLCLNVDDLEALHARLSALGYRFRSDVVPITRGALAGAKAVYAIDPDGYHVELFQRKERT